jgi:hypothetical protein
LARHRLAAGALKEGLGIADGVGFLVEAALTAPDWRASLDGGIYVRLMFQWSKGPGPTIAAYVFRPDSFCSTRFASASYSLDILMSAERESKSGCFKA